jgi:hypothetical protein
MAHRAGEKAMPYKINTVGPGSKVGKEGPGYVAQIPDMHTCMEWIEVGHLKFGAKNTRAYIWLIHESLLALRLPHPIHYL